MHETEAIPTTPRTALPFARNRPQSRTSSVQLDVGFRLQVAISDLGSRISDLGPRTQRYQSRQASPSWGFLPPTRIREVRDPRCKLLAASARGVSGLPRPSSQTRRSNPGRDSRAIRAIRALHKSDVETLRESGVPMRSSFHRIHESPRLAPPGSASMSFRRAADTLTILPSRARPDAHRPWGQSATTAGAAG